MYPGSGPKPVAEGIAGMAPHSHDTESGNNRSFLMSLCENGQQYVKVTKVFKKNVALMFMQPDPNIRYLDEVVTPPAPSDTMVKWSVTYLVDKNQEAERLA